MLSLELGIRQHITSFLNYEVHGPHHNVFWHPNIMGEDWNLHGIRIQVGEFDRNFEFGENNNTNYTIINLSGLMTFEEALALQNDPARDYLIRYSDNSNEEFKFRHWQVRYQYKDNYDAMFPQYTESTCYPQNTNWWQGWIPEKLFLFEIAQHPRWRQGNTLLPQPCPQPGWWSPNHHICHPYILAIAYQGNAEGNFNRWHFTNNNQIEFNALDNDSLEENDEEIDMDIQEQHEQEESSDYEILENNQIDNHNMNDNLLLDDNSNSTDSLFADDSD